MRNWNTSCSCRTIVKATPPTRCSRKRDTGTVEDVINYGVPIYYTREDALIKGSHTWCVNYGAEKCGETKVTPDWKTMNCAFETSIIESANMDSIDDKELKWPTPPPEVLSKRAKVFGEVKIES